MTRLIHLNGPPGIGKSTLARRYADEHPGVLNCDIDVLRTLVGGWKQDFLMAGSLIRTSALAMIGAYLRQGHDVVLPQMLMNPMEIARFEACAEEAGAEFVERMFLDTLDSSVARFHRRGANERDDPWHDQVKRIVKAQGGDEQLRRCHAALVAIASERQSVLTIESVPGKSEETYRLLLSSLALS